MLLKGLNHFAKLYLELLESQDWERGEGCGTHGGSCTDTKENKFWNSKEMGYHRQYCKGLGDHDSSKGIAGCIVGTWLIYVED